MVKLDIRPTVYLCLFCLVSRARALFGWNWVLTNPHNVEQTDTRRMRDPPNMDDASAFQFGRQPNDNNSRHCQRDSQCAVGHFCDKHYGLCKQFRKESDACRSDGNCEPGQDCMFGRCAKAIKPGLQGARCESDDECSKDFCCARKHGQKVCKPKLLLGQRCYVPDGGLAYFLNEMCPCVDELICGAITRNFTANGNGNEWLRTRLNETRTLLRCIRH